MQVSVQHKAQYFPNSEPQILVYHMPHLFLSFSESQLFPQSFIFTYHLSKYEAFVTVS